MAGAKRKQQESALELCLHFPPFLVHVALVLTVGWISSRLNFNLPFVFTFGLVYLYLVEERIKAKTEARIRSEERRADDRKRVLLDAETARWLNSTVEAIWPIFLESFASQKFLMSLAPWFLEKYKPWTAKKVVLQQICLGSCPPVFTMLRCGRNPTDGDHLVLEMDMKFVAARDMSAVMAVQMRKRVGLGLWTSLNISNIQIEGKIRVGVRFKKGWPVVERLRVCFAEAPILRMTAKPIINYGIDVTDLPGIASWIDKMIADALEQSLVEPNVLEVEVEKLVGDLMAVSAKLQTPIYTKPGPWFSVRNPKVHLSGTLKVEILEGKNLKPSDPNGKADPYVKVTFGSAKCVTAIKHKTLQPAWYETFQFPVESWDLPNRLQLRVRDKDRFGHDDKLGRTEIECKAFNDGVRHEMWVTLDDVKTGELRIAITVVDVPVVENVTQLPKSNGTPESGNEKSETSSSDEKTRKSATYSHNVDVSDSDYEECPLGEREPVDVGYGQLGAVSIVTPGKAEVKEATTLERLRRRKTPAASRVKIDGNGTAAPCTDPLLVPAEGRRSKFKRLWRKDKRPSLSDSSEELGIIAVGEKGTEVHMAVETAGEGCKTVITCEGTSSSGELQPADEEDQNLDECRAEKHGMKKVQNMMLHIGRKAHIVGSAFSKMSPSRKRSHSAKALCETPVSVNERETNVPKASSCTGESTGAKVLQAESTSGTEGQVNATNVIEVGNEIHEPVAETGNLYITRGSFVSTVPSTASDHDDPSVVHPTPSKDAEYFYAESVPTATPTITEKIDPSTPINAAFNTSSGSRHSLSKNSTVVNWPTKEDHDFVDTGAVSSCEIVRNYDEERVNALRTFPKSFTVGSSQISSTEMGDVHTEAAESVGEEQLGEQRTVLTDLEQDVIAQHSFEENPVRHALSDQSHDDLYTPTDSNPSVPPTRPPPEVPGEMRLTDDPLEIPEASQIDGNEGVPRDSKFRRVEGFTDAGILKSPPVDKAIHHTHGSLAPIKEGAHVLKSEAHDVFSRMTAESLIVRKVGHSPRGFIRSPKVDKTSVTTSSWSSRGSSAVSSRAADSNAGLKNKHVLAEGSSETEEAATASEPAAEHGDGYDLKSCTSVHRKDCRAVDTGRSSIKILTDDSDTSRLSADGTPVASSSGRRESPGGVGSASAKSYFSRVGAFKDRGSRLSFSSKESSSVATLPLAPETKDRGRNLLNKSESPSDEGNAEVRNVQSSSDTVAALPEEDVQRPRDMQEAAGIVWDSPGISSLSSRDGIPESSNNSGESLCKYIARTTSTSLLSEVENNGGDGIPGRSQDPLLTSISDCSSVTKRHQEPTALLNAEEETPRLLLSRSRNPKDVETAVSTSSSVGTHGFREASSTRSTSPTCLPPTEDSSFFAAAEKETALEHVVTFSEEKFSQGLDMHPLPEVEVFTETSAKIVSSVGNTSTKSVFSRTKGFRQPIDVGSVSPRELAPATEAFPVSDREEVSGNDDTNKCELLSETPNYDKSLSLECPSAISFSSPSMKDKFPIREGSSSDVSFAGSFSPPREILPGSIGFEDPISDRSFPSTEHTPVADGLLGSGAGLEEERPTKTMNSECSSVMSSSPRSGPRLPSLEHQNIFEASSSSPTRRHSMMEPGNASSASAKSFFSRTKGFKEPSGGSSRSLSARELSQVTEASLVARDKKGSHCP